MSNLFLFGYGFSGRALARRLAAKGWTVSATHRNDATAARIAADGHTPIDLGDRDAVTDALGDANAMLVTAPPGSQGCPGLNNLVGPMAEANAFPDWAGYLSTTGVYGDRHGGWVTEDSRLAAQSVEGARRVGAERDWLDVGRGMGLTVTIFRLPGIYGPGRSPLERVAAGRAHRVGLPTQVFSRVHVDDIVAGVLAARHAPPGAYNLADDRPCPQDDVVAFAAGLLRRPPPPIVALETLSPMARAFYAENRRVANGKAKRLLGWRPAYPDYRLGLRALNAMTSPMPASPAPAAASGDQ